MVSSRNMASVPLGTGGDLGTDWSSKLDSHATRAALDEKPVNDCRGNPCHAPLAKERVRQGCSTRRSKMKEVPLLAKGATRGKRPLGQTNLRKRKKEKSFFWFAL